MRLLTSAANRSSRVESFSTTWLEVSLFLFAQSPLVMYSMNAKSIKTGTALLLASGLLMLLLASGCAPGPMTGGAFASGPTGAAPPELGAQLQTLNERLGQFDADNQELHSQVAQLQQTLQVSEQEKRLLKQQLADASQALEQTQVAKQEIGNRLNAMQASNQFRGGATITANSSLNNQLRAIDIPGVEIRSEADVLRIELPADRLFAPSTSEIQQSGMALMDQVGNAIRQYYPNQLIGIEGHTDPTTASRTLVSDQQLTATQALAVYHYLTRTGRVPPAQLFTMGLGANRPRFSNGEPIGRSRNRRIEIVVYPETYTTQ